MNCWTLFAQINKINFKKNSLVACLATGLFLNKNENIDFSCLKETYLHLVPPILDSNNKIKTKDIVVTKDNLNSITITYDNLVCTNVDYKHYKKLLIENTQLNKLLKNNNINVDKNIIFGFDVVDNKLGNIAKVLDVSGTHSQQNIVAQTSADKIIYIPYVEEIVNKIENNKIYVDLPKGLIDLN